jgi:hypothetical protein
MAYVLRDGLFQVKCRQSGCPFKSEFKIAQTIMGATDRDCESEAMKIAQNMAAIKHDAIYGRTHILKDPLVRKVGGTYVPFGAGASPAAGQAAAQDAAAFDPGLPRPPGAVAVRKYAKGEIILRKGDRATTVCEVLTGAACAEPPSESRYVQGQSFGAAGLLTNQERTGNVLAETDGAVIAFYNIQDLTRSNPAKARELYNEIMEDALHVIAYLDTRVHELEDALETAEASVQEEKAASRSKPKPAAKKAPASRKPAAKTAPKGRRKG